MPLKLISRTREQGCRTSRFSADKHSVSAHKANTPHHEKHTRCVSQMCHAVWLRSQTAHDTCQQRLSLILSASPCPLGLQPMDNRSPLLTTTSGLAGVLAGSTAVSRTVVFPGLQSLFILRIISIPLTVFCFVAVYILRGLRVLVMYNPSRRQRWGRFLKKEAAMVKILLAAFVIAEVAAWIAVRHVGLAR